MFFIEMNKCTVSDNNVNIYCNKHKQPFTELHNAYRCMRTFKITDKLITKTKGHVCKTILLWRELKLPVSPSAHLFEGHIVYQMENVVGGLADKSEDHIERTRQDGKRSERIYCELTNFKQFQVSQLKNNDMMINPEVRLKPEQIKTNQK